MEWARWRLRTLPFDSFFIRTLTISLCNVIYNFKSYEKHEVEKSIYEHISAYKYNFFFFCRKWKSLFFFFCVTHAIKVKEAFIFFFSLKKKKAHGLIKYILVWDPV